MKSTKKLRMVFVVPLILLFGFQFFYSKEKSVDPFRVKRLPGKRTINIADKSLKDWNSSFLVMKIDSKNSFTNQWETIKGHAPKPLSINDIDIRVYMVRDKNYWYIAIEAIDDKLLSVTSSSLYPYSGDCLEIFFAGKELNGEFDIHNYVQSPSALPDQAAFFQFELPPIELDNKSNFFPDYRTDLTFSKNVIRSGFVAQVWRSNSRWYAEARIPFSAFDSHVVDQINNHSPLKLNIDYLDYDIRLEKHEEPNWGFDPGNVFCLDNEEKFVNTPLNMRSLIFE